MLKVAINEKKLFRVKLSFPSCVKSQIEVLKLHISWKRTEPLAGGLAQHHHCNLFAIPTVLHDH